MIGSNHGNLAAALVPELLSTHPFFMTSEPDVDDPACILPSQQLYLVKFLTCTIRHLYSCVYLQCNSVLLHSTNAISITRVPSL